LLLQLELLLLLHQMLLQKLLLPLLLHLLQLLLLLLELELLILLQILHPVLRRFLLGQQPPLLQQLLLQPILLMRDLLALLLLQAPHLLLLKEPELHLRVRRAGKRKQKADDEWPLQHLAPRSEKERTLNVWRWGHRNQGVPYR